MGSIDRRIEALEKLYGVDEGAEEKERRTEEMRAAMLTRLERAREQAEREETAGDPRRRLALDELEEAIRKRRERGA